MSALGHNNPPEPTPFEAAKDRIEALYEEAKNWLDGAELENQAQADALGTLMDAMRKAHKSADEARKVEAKPFDDGKAEVQARYKPLLDRAERAVDTLKKSLAIWLRKEEGKKRKAAEAACLEAEAKAKEAAAAIAAAAPDNLEAREQAESKIDEAKAADAAAKRAANDTAKVAGGARSASLRTYYVPVLADFFAALDHYAATRPDEIEATLLKLANEDVRAGKRQIPGFTIKTEQRVA